MLVEEAVALEMETLVIRHLEQNLVAQGEVEPEQQQTHILLQLMELLVLVAVVVAEDMLDLPINLVVVAARESLSCLILSRLLHNVQSSTLPDHGPLHLVSRPLTTL